MKTGVDVALRERRGKWQRSSTHVRIVSPTVCHMGYGREDDWEGSAKGTFWTTIEREMTTRHISLMGTVPRCFTYALEVEILSKEPEC